jgi:uncharacterized membrane protein
MSPTVRKIVYAVSFEALGIVVAALALSVMSDASPGSTVALSVVLATVALVWSFAYNTLFEAWEARQPVRGRSFRRRAVHALLFEGGLVTLMVPIMAWWLGVTPWQALVYEAALIVLFILYTWVFTWGFDRIFGLPISAR